MTQENYDQILSETHFYDTGDLLLEDNPQILRIISRSNDTWKLDQLRNEMRHSIHELAVSEDSAYCIQVTAIEAQKGAALLAYMRDHRLSLKNTLIIGDGHEDYSMLGLLTLKVSPWETPLMKLRKSANIRPAAMTHPVPPRFLKFFSPHYPRQLIRTNYKKAENRLLCFFVFLFTF